MTRIWAMSDLHIEVNGEPMLEPPPHDVVVLAGNISDSLSRSVEWATETFEAPVIMVAGNREFWGADRMAALGEGRVAAQRSGGRVRLIEGEAAVVAGVAFVGGTLWTDYGLYGDSHRQWVKHHCGAVIDDHKRILSDGYRSGRWDPDDAERAHRVTLASLRALAACNRDRPLVVVTHHAPHIRSVGGCWTADYCGAALASNLEHDIAAMNPVAWVHGHAQNSLDYTVGSTRVICNPLGIRSKSPCDVTGNRQFDRSFVLDAGVDMRDRALCGS